MVSTPFISPSNVRIALDSLLYTSSNKAISLLSLLLVDEFLIQPDLPRSSLSREFALSHVLTSLISAEFAHLRHISGYPIPESDTPRELVLEMLHYDAELMSPELIGWSWLYHHYVRIDLDIQAQIFCDALHIEERTLRRYQQHILKRLTNLLIENEWAARVRQQKRCLLSKLPRTANIDFFDAREDTSNYVKQMFAQAKPAHFCISGSRGVGKTTFVEGILHDQINEGVIDQLVWVQMPVSVAYVHNYLLEHLVPPEAQIELRGYLLLHRTVIVLDDMESLFSDVSHLRELLYLLSPAVVFMTYSSAYAALPDTIEVTLKEFNESDARTFATHVLASTQYAVQASDEQIATIWDRVGGNPLALQMIIRNLPYFDLKSIDSLLGLNTVYDRIFRLLDKKGQFAWIILALSPPSEVEFSELQHTWPKYITRDSIGNLLQYHIIEVSTHSLRYRFITGARHYIEDMYQRDDEPIRELTNYLLPEFDSTISLQVEHSNLFLPQLEYILLAGWINLDTYLRGKWISNWWPEGVRYKHWATWRTLLETQIASNIIDVKVYRGYAICLQHLGEWSLSQQVIEAILSETGRKGAFIEQAETLLQLSVILRHRGKYEKAFEILSRVKEIAIRHHSNPLILALSVEQIRLAVDLGDPQFAKPFIPHLPDNIQSYFLKSEIYFLEGDYEQSRTYAQLALPYAKNDFVVRARIYTLIGRICEQENNLEGAQENFSWSLMILEQNDDAFGLSRAQLNLGALFIRTGHYEEAAALLQAAEKIQRQLGNEVTLAAIRHNLRLLDIAFSN
jgi:tetratricopeptide (TPR) repeat protein